MNDTAMRVELSAQELVHLRDLLDVAVSDLSPEIAATDNAEYRAGLRDRRESLRSIRNKLGT